MDNVIDFFSKRSYKNLTTKDFQKNDELTEKHGIYLGCLKHQDTKEMRNLIAEMDFKREQIDKLTVEWENQQFQYQELLQHCLGYLNLPRSISINHEKDSVMVSEEGHSWVIYDYEKEQ